MWVLSPMMTFTCRLACFAGSGLEHSVTCDLNQSFFSQMSKVTTVAVALFWFCNSAGFALFVASLSTGLVSDGLDEHHGRICDCGCVPPLGEILNFFLDCCCPAISRLYIFLF